VPTRKVVASGLADPGVRSAADQRVRPIRHVIQFHEQVLLSQFARLLAVSAMITSA
jgi:hypothetical protein